jgi:hypothetical protein
MKEGSRQIRLGMKHKKERERESYAWLQEMEAETAVLPYIRIYDFVLYKARYQAMSAHSMRLSSSP